MLIPNHPDDERLSALASRDSDATADATLAAHVSSCIRCTGLVSELGALRLALADLPDLAPSRPLQLVPPVEADHAVDRVGGWARRFFAPVLVSGAALVLVGVVGTAGPAFSGMASSGQAGATPYEAAVASSAQREYGAPAPAASQPAAQENAGASDMAAAPGAAAGGDASGSARARASDEVNTFESDGGLAAVDAPGSDESDREETSSAQTDLEASRSPWPMVLFAGVALIVAALLMRWILAPRSA
jgi:hypothetical protein